MVAAALLFAACSPQAPAFELGGATVRVEDSNLSEQREYRWPITVSGDSGAAYFVAYEVRFRDTGNDTSTHAIRMSTVVLGRGDSIAWSSYETKCTGYPLLSDCVVRPRDPRPVLKVLGLTRALK